MKQTQFLSEQSTNGYSRTWQVTMHSEPIKKGHQPAANTSHHVPQKNHHAQYFFNKHASLNAKINKEYPTLFMMQGNIKFPQIVKETKIQGKNANPVFYSQQRLLTTGHFCNTYYHKVVNHHFSSKQSNSFEHRTGLHLDTIA